MKITTNVQDLSKQIKAVHASVTKLEGIIQGVLMSVTFHAMAHGNIEPLTTFFDGMPKGVRRQALAAWLDTYAPVLFQEKGTIAFSREKLATLGEFADPSKPTPAEAEAYALKLAASNWVEFKPEPPTVESFDVAKALAALLAKVDKLAKGGTQIVGVEVVAELRKVGTSTKPAATV